MAPLPQTPLPLRRRIHLLRRHNARLPRLHRFNPLRHLNQHRNIHPALLPNLEHRRSSRPSRHHLPQTQPNTLPLRPVLYRHGQIPVHTTLLLM